jgi:hypothetical protein
MLGFKGDYILDAYRRRLVNDRAMLKIRFSVEIDLTDLERLIALGAMFA